MTRHFNTKRGAEIHISHSDKYAETTNHRQPDEQQAEREKVRKQIDDFLFSKELNSIESYWDSL